MKASFVPLFLTVLLSLFHGSFSLPTTIGVTYTTPPPTATTTNTPKLPPERIAATISGLHLQAVRLPESAPSLVRAFAFVNTSLLLTIPNQLVPSLAFNRSNALGWVYRHVLPFYPRSRISMVSVGNDFLANAPDLSPYLLPAIRNVQLALRDLGIKKIAVSTIFSFINIIAMPFPPSSATFQAPIGDYVIRPFLQFLEETNSSFLVNVYPYNMYRLNSDIPIGFALFQDHPFNFRDDLVTGVRYRNLFDMMVDAVITAMAVAGHESIQVIVAETGWPSFGGDAVEADATTAYAEMYLKGLLRHLRSGVGTPLRKEGVAEVYIYELVDTEVKQGNRNWGILYPNMTKKYNLDFSSANEIYGHGENIFSSFL
ncbi:glucan endo-1,3-beta-glucosidase, acidic [Tripterygium wilfordii]|uniref:glucan endo-1,3-beta-glucosidase, acidic n=1 Tax=Tripterygium wilfordii TaxID=458696 RepID=UPI0018F7F7B3|nr:glucan endo-1,3-beta-glucosidase, acidic [Tripterygium wilfordii]